MSSPTSSTAPPTPVPEASPRKGAGITLGVIVSFMFLTGVDGTVVNTALPKVEEALHFSTTTVSWVLNAYTLTFGGLLLLGGRLGDVLGRRNLFITGIAVFTVASLLGGLAQDDWWLIAARSLQGLGAALAGPSMMALVMTNFEGPARARAMALYSAVLGVGASCGMVLGGIITTYASWRWSLLINVFLGPIIAVLAPRYVKQPQRNTGRFDIPGAIAGTLAITSLVYGFIRAASDGWGDDIAVAAFVAGIVLLAAFLIIERRAPQPLTPLHLLATPSRAGAYATTFFLVGSQFSMYFLLTQYMQHILGYSPLRSGLAFLTMTIGQFSAVRVVPKILPKFGAKLILLTGSSLALIGMIWLTQLSVDSSYFTSLFGPMLIIGVGMGISFPTLNITVLAGIPPKDSGAASGLLQSLQWVGGTLGLAIFVTVLGSAYRGDLRNPVGATAAEQANHALTDGISTAYIAAAVAAGLALVLTAVFVPRRVTPPAKATGAPAGGPAGAAGGPAGGPAGATPAQKDAVGAAATSAPPSGAATAPSRSGPDA